MANVFEYVISIKDRATAAARSITGTTAGISAAMERVEESTNRIRTRVPATFAAISSRARQAVQGPQFLRRSIDELRNRLEEVNRVRFGTVLRSEFREAGREARNLESQINRLQRGMGSGIGGRVAGWREDFASSLPGANLIKNPLVMAGAAVGGLWAATSKAMDAGKEKMKLQVLTGSEQIGTALYDGLTKFATDTVFGSELYDYGTQMLANGIANADVVPVMKELGDIAMGDANKLGQLSLAFAQINGKGKLAGQELLQLINAGFNPLQVISEKTGESMGSLQDRMSKGQISIADVRGAMQTATGEGGKFHNMLEKVANTPYGQLENLKGQMDQMFIKIGEVFLPIASKMMSFFSWIGEKLGPLMQPVAAVIGGLAIGLLAVAAAQWAWNAAQLANPVTWIVAGVVALIATIAYLVTAFDGWGAAWKNLMSGFKNEWLYVTGSFKLVWLQVVDKFMWGVDAIAKAWYKVQSLWDEDGANAGLAKLQQDGDRRSREIAYQKGLTQAYRNIAGGAYGDVIGEKGLHKNDKTLKGTIDGIAGAVMPGMAGMGGAGGAKKNDAGKKTNEAIATGGTKNTTIHITIGKQVESLTVVSNNIKEGASKIREIIVDEMIRAAQMGAAMAGN